METIKLLSRYKNVNTYLKMFDDKLGILLSNGEYTRCILSEDNKHIQSVDFEGGPMISVGKDLKKLGKVKSIKACYYVEFE